MDINKIKYKEGRVIIDYDVKRGPGEPDNYSVNSSDPPHPTFVVAMGDLRACILKECELPAEWKDEITARSVTISRYSDGRWGATICGLRNLKNSNCPLVLNTPHKASEEAFEGDRMILDDGTVDAIELLIKCAEAYIRGERAQMALSLAN